MTEDSNATPNEPRDSDAPVYKSQSDIALGLATRRVWVGLAWWVAAAVAMIFALSSSDTTVFFWWGGAIVGAIAWFRAFQLFRVAKESATQENRKLVLNPRKHYLPVGITAAVVVSSLAIVVPAYEGVTSPGVGTCYAVKSGSLTPVACFSPSAKVKAVQLVTDPNNCSTSEYMDPDPGSKEYTCLQRLN